MSIDITVSGSPGWWMARLYAQLQSDLPRMQRLQDRYDGKPPLPMSTDNARSWFYAFQRTAKSNFAAAIVDAACERIAVRAISTSDSGDDGDQQSWAQWSGNDLDVDQANANVLAWTMGRAYYCVGSPPTSTTQPVITTEDPRQVITQCSPLRPRWAVAAFKLFHDESADLDVAVLWLPGRKYYATRQRRAKDASAAVKFSPAGFTLQPFTEGVAQEGDDYVLEGEDGTYPNDVGYYSERYADLEIPVYCVSTRDGKGAFEKHEDLLDRINHMILQRVTIATYQAFRQRAIELGDDAELPKVDDDGNKIDYDNLFAADPGSLWMLPAGAKVWESGQVDLTGIISAVKEDVLHLAALTRTPLPMFTPDAATQTAEGATLQREGLVFKVEDYCRGLGRTIARVIAAGFRFMASTADGDPRRDPANIAVDFAPTERNSLADMASADSLSISLPFEDKMRIIYQMTPAQIRAAQTHRAADLVYTQLAAQQAAAAAAIPAGAQAIRDAPPTQRTPAPEPTPPPRPPEPSRRTPAPAAA